MTAKLERVRWTELQYQTTLNIGDEAMLPSSELRTANNNSFKVDFDGWPFDPKGDPDHQRRMKFFLKGQTAFGEWFKRLGPKDRPPRGRCFMYFKTHKHLR